MAGGDTLEVIVGIARETAGVEKAPGLKLTDSILLDRGQHPIFVVDVHTRRVLERHQAATKSAK